MVMNIFDPANGDSPEREFAIQFEVAVKSGEAEEVLSCLADWIPRLLHDDEMPDRYMPFVGLTEELASAFLEEWADAERDFAD